MTCRRLTSLVFTVLIAFAPSGTRYIFRTGNIDGNPVEPGTVSLFGMQIVALAFIALTVWLSGTKPFTELLYRPAPAAAAGVALIAALSVLGWNDPLAGVSAAWSVWLGVGLFMAILVFRPDPHEVLTSFVGGAVFQFGLGAWQFLTQSAFASKWLGMAMHSPEQLGAFVIETGTGRWLRAYGSLSHPNVFGLYVGVGLLMCIGLAAFRGHGRHLRFYSLMPVIAAGLMFSFSRSAMLAVAAGFVWMTISAYGSEAAPAFRRVIVPSFIIIAVTMGALGAFYAEPLRTRTTADGRLEIASLEERGTQLSEAATLVAAHPVTGVGIGRMPLAVKEEVDPRKPWWQYQYVHNVPLLVAVETGVFGFAAWAAVVGATILVIVRRLKKKTPVSTGVTVYAASFIALLVASLFDHFLWSSWFGQLLFWGVAGLLHAAYLNLEERHS